MAQDVNCSSVTFLRTIFPSIPAETLAAVLHSSNGETQRVIDFFEKDEISGDFDLELTGLRLVEAFPNLDAEHIFSFVRRNPTVPEKDFFEIFAFLTPSKPRTSERRKAKILWRATTPAQLSELERTFCGSSNSHQPNPAANATSTCVARDDFFAIPRHLLQRGDTSQHHRELAAFYGKEMSKNFASASTQFASGGTLGRQSASYFAERGHEHQSKMHQHKRVAAYLNFLER